MLTNEEAKKLMYLKVKETEDYNVYLTKDLSPIYVFNKKPDKNMLLELFHREKLKRFCKYVYVYIHKYTHKQIYICDSFTTDGNKVSWNMPDISMYDFKQEIFDYLTKKGNKGKFWEYFDKHLKVFKSLDKVYIATYDRLLGIYRLPKKKKRKEEGKQMELFSKKVSLKATKTKF